MDRSVYPFLAKYTQDDGTLIWGDGVSPYPSRDGADDFYESFYNWPLLYLLGGGDHLLPLSLRQWEATTRLLTRLGLVYREYERGYDQFHQAESYIYFYFLCLADPTNPRLLERARRFAGLYLGEDPAAPNYDPVHRLIRAPHNGSAGPRPGRGDGEPIYAWTEEMARYGLPYHDVPGIATYDDLKDPVLARRMGEVMYERMGRGDVAANLAVTSLVSNAYLLTGDEKYRRWVLEYVDAWVERARQNGGLLPDNVGLSGRIGEYIGGKWYGGLYGWTWPHGFYNIGMSTTVAATNAYLLSHDTSYLDLARAQMDRVIAEGRRHPVRDLAMSLEEHWVGQLPQDCDREAFVVPYRYSDAGWFDYQPMSPVCPTAIWNISMQATDWERLERLRHESDYDWRQVVPFRNKEECGHEQPWLRYLAAENPTYPEAMLRATYGQVCRRLEQIRRDDADLATVNIHHWQDLNPVLTEALVQLMLGAPQIVYNGGLLHCRVRYFDAERRRPGLPPDIAALVKSVEAERTVVHLVNLSPFEAREMIVQAGAFAEHRFTTATFTMRASEYPGPIGSYAAPELHVETRTTPIDDARLHVHLPPATEIALDLGTARYANSPSYTLPW
jgi:hypothetical protein